MWYLLTRACRATGYIPRRLGSCFVTTIPSWHKVIWFLTENKMGRLRGCKQKRYKNRDKTTVICLHRTECVYLHWKSISYFYMMKCYVWSLQHWHYCMEKNDKVLKENLGSTSVSCLSKLCKKGDVEATNPKWSIPLKWT